MQKIDSQRLNPNNTLSQGEANYIAELYKSSKGLLGINQYYNDNPKLNSLVNKDYKNWYKKKFTTNQLKLIQEKIGVPADGSFGMMTFKAILRWQDRNGHKVDGLIGQKALKVMDIDNISLYIADGKLTKKEREGITKQYKEDKRKLQENVSGKLKNFFKTDIIDYHNKKYSKEIIEDIQKGLGTTVTGVFSQQDLFALYRFQKSKNITVGYNIGPRTIELLTKKDVLSYKVNGISSIPILYNETNGNLAKPFFTLTPEMKELINGDLKQWYENNYSKQEILLIQKKVGARNDDGSYDGVFGPNTFKAILRWQKENNLEIDGLIIQTDFKKYISVDYSGDKVHGKDNLDSKNNLQIKNEFIEKYSQEYKSIQRDIADFFNASFDNAHRGELSDFNVNKFDNKDGKAGFSKYELELFTQIIDKALNQMNILGSYEKFKKEYKEINNKDPDFFSWKGDIAVSNKMDAQEILLGDAENHISENFHSFSEEELHFMREQKFDITDRSKMKNFVILLGLELGDGIEDILRFLGNIPAAGVVLPRYIHNRAVLLRGEVDSKNKVEAQMENDMLLKENPALMLCELVGEQGVEMLKQLLNMFVSGKNGDIATLCVTIAGLLAGGAGAVKVVAKGAGMSRTANIAGNIARRAGRVDDIVGGAGIGHLTGQYSAKTPSINSSNVKSISDDSRSVKRIEDNTLNTSKPVIGKEADAGNKQIENKTQNTSKTESLGEESGSVQNIDDKTVESSGVESKSDVSTEENTLKESTIASEEVLIENGKLNDNQRIKKAEEVLGIDNLSPDRADVLLKAHNLPQGQNFQKGRILMGKLPNGEQAFTRAEAQKLMDQGIAGRFVPDFESNIGVTLTNKIDNKLLDDIQRNSSERVQEYLKYEEYKPRHTITIGEQTFLVSGKLKYSQYEVFIGYIKVNDEYKPRYFYKSQSGGNWRSSPTIIYKQSGEYAGSYKFDKGENIGLNYEKGTVIPSALSSKLEDIKFVDLSKIPEDKQNIYKSEDFYHVFVESGEINTKLFKESINKIVLFDNRLISEKNGKIGIRKLNDFDSVEELTNFYKSINFNENNLNNIRKVSTRSVYNKKLNDKVFIDKIEFNYVDSKSNSIPLTLEIAYSKSDPNLPWVENLYFSDAKINSYGVLDKQIQAGLLTTKPFEYTKQIDNIKGLKNHGAKYTDIRSIIQENPFIRIYKEIKSKDNPDVNLDLSNTNKSALDSNSSNKVDTNNISNVDSKNNSRADANNTSTVDSKNNSRVDKNKNPENNTTKSSSNTETIKKKPKVLPKLDLTTEQSQILDNLSTEQITQLKQDIHVKITSMIDRKNRKNLQPGSHSVLMNLYRKLDPSSSVDVSIKDIYSSVAYIFKKEGIQLNFLNKYKNKPKNSSRAETNNSANRERTNSSRAETNNRANREGTNSSRAETNNNDYRKRTNSSRAETNNNAYREGTNSSRAETNNRTNRERTNSSRVDNVRNSLDNLKVNTVSNLKDWIKNDIRNNGIDILKNAIIIGSVVVYLQNTIDGEIIFNDSEGRVISNEDIQILLDSNNGEVNISQGVINEEGSGIINEEGSDVIQVTNIQNSEYLQAIISSEIIKDVNNPTIEELTNILDNESLRKEKGIVYNYAIQSALQKLGYGDIVGKVDGYLGPKTKKAIEAYQTDNGLDPDGILGPLTAIELISDIQD